MGAGARWVGACTQQWAPCSIDRAPHMGHASLASRADIAASHTEQRSNKECGVDLDETKGSAALHANLTKNAALPIQGAHTASQQGGTPTAVSPIHSPRKPRTQGHTLVIHIIHQVCNISQGHTTFITCGNQTPSDSANNTHVHAAHAQALQ